jgi:hypothetical protein
MITNITIGKIEIKLEISDPKKVSIDIFCEDEYIEDERDEMNLIGTVHDYLLKEGFLEPKHKYCLRFDIHPTHYL